MNAHRATMSTDTRAAHPQPPCRSLWTAAAMCLLAITGVSRALPAEPGKPEAANSQPNAITADRAIQIAFTLNRDIIGARLNLKEAEYDKVAAQTYTNPVLSYQVGDLVLGHGNGQSQTPPIRPGFFSQTVHSVGVAQALDVWAKRSYRIKAAEQELQYRRLLLEDVHREIAYAVATAYNDVLRQRSELEFAIEVRERYSETVRLSKSRFSAGEISEAEFRKIDLEGLKYGNAVIDQQTEHDLAVATLAAVMGLDTASRLGELLEEAQTPPLQANLAELTKRALLSRPDLRALDEGKRFALASLASANREAYPDVTLGVTYTHSEFQVSGDNPNSLAVGVAVPLPIFDRNQANIARAQLAILRVDNDRSRLVLGIRQQVAAAVRTLRRTEELLALFRQGSMLDSAKTALQVAEKSYKAGAVSLLEFLEAQRTYLGIHEEFLRAQYDQRQSLIDLTYALGTKPQ